MIESNEDRVQSPTSESGVVARLDEASYQNGIIEREAILDAQAKQATKDESVWQAENEELLSEFKQGTEEHHYQGTRTITFKDKDLQGFELHLRRLSGTLKRINLRQNLINKLKYGPRIDGPTGDKGIAAISLEDQPDQDPDSQPKTEDDLTPFSGLEVLEELDLYDNQISKIEGLHQLPNLKTLDFSFNLIRKIENLDSLESLSTLYLIQNNLELGSNRIRHITNLSCLINLTELWLGRNKISKLEGLDSLVNLRSLSIQSNRIIKLEGLSNLVSLEELYISHNGLTSIGDGLPPIVLDIGANQIDDMTGIEGLNNLEELWANNNKMSIPGWNSIENYLAKDRMKDLQTIYLEGNPLQSEMGVNYRRKILIACPQLIQIDATLDSKEQPALHTRHTPNSSPVLHITQVRPAESRLLNSIGGTGCLQPNLALLQHHLNSMIDHTQPSHGPSSTDNALSTSPDAPALARLLTSSSVSTINNAVAKIGLTDDATMAEFEKKTLRELRDLQSTHIIYRRLDLDIKIEAQNLYFDYVKKQHLLSLKHQRPFLALTKYLGQRRTRQKESTWHKFMKHDTSAQAALHN
ncbi:hypothetical protein H4Q26_015954, partial [Puccinia striiformis f. sp. tritici PST-130]